MRLFIMPGKSIHGTLIHNEDGFQVYQSVRYESVVSSGDAVCHIQGRYRVCEMRDFSGTKA
ncbi:MAG: hypothetical protein U0L73_06465 [Ruminococcus bromii]|nr:hypothetical protein [Ruminococcus bromii]